MRRRWIATRRRIALGAAVALTTAAGCSTVSPVAAPAALSVTGFAYSAGKATQDFNVPTPTVKKAVADAMEDLRMRPVKETHDGVAILIEGRTADDRRAVITLRPHQEMTRLSVKVFWFGDESLSRAFMDRVGIRLGTNPPAPIPETPPSKPDPNPLFSRPRSYDPEMLEKQAELRFHDRESP